MVSRTVNPRLKECIEVYQNAYERHGTDSFTVEQLSLEGSEADLQRLLELATAYGLLEFDGTTYRVSCDPDSTADCWESVIKRRTDKIRDMISDSVYHDEGESTEASELVHEDKIFASIFVNKTDGFDSVVRSLENISRDGKDGVVLRSPGDRAGAVQRIADRLCDPKEIEHTSVATPFQKEFTDVVGHEKDALEFRLFLLYI